MSLPHQAHYANIVLPRQASHLEGHVEIVPSKLGGQHRIRISATTKAHLHPSNISVLHLLFSGIASLSSALFTKPVETNQFSHKLGKPAWFHWTTKFLEKQTYVL
jgi:hypothetical protein